MPRCTKIAYRTSAVGYFCAPRSSGCRRTPYTSFALRSHSVAFASASPRSAEGAPKHACAVGYFCAPRSSGCRRTPYTALVLCTRFVAFASASPRSAEGAPKHRLFDRVFLHAEEFRLSPNSLYYARASLSLRGVRRGSRAGKYDYCLYLQSKIAFTRL